MLNVITAEPEYGNPAPAPAFKANDAVAEYDAVPANCDELEPVQLLKSADDDNVRFSKYCKLSSPSWNVNGEPFTSLFINAIFTDI